MRQEIPTAPIVASEDEGEPIDLRSVALIFRRRLRPFLLVASIVFALVLLFALTRPNIYTSGSNVLIQRQKAEVTNVDAVLSDLPEDSASVDTEVQVLRSPGLMRAVAEKLSLVNDPEFNGALRGSSLLARLKSLASDAAESVGSEQQDALDRVVANMADSVEVTRRGLTYVIAVEVTTRDPVKSAGIANTIAELYIQRQIDQKRTAATDAQRYLRSRLSGLGAEVQSKEAAAQAVRARAGLPTGANMETYDQQVIQDTSRQTVELESTLAEKRGQLAAARQAQSNPAALPAVIESNVIRDMKARRAEALARSADVSARYGPLHPETRRIRDELAQIDSEIGREMQSIIASLSQEVQVAERRLGAVRGQLAGQRGASVANSRNAARVQQIDREALASRGVYEDFLKRSKETAETEDLATADAVVISRAIASPGPSGPNRPLLLAGGAAVALAFGILGVILLELIDIKISSGADIQRYLGLKRLVSIPDLPAPDGVDSHSLLITQRPLSSYTEAYRDLSDIVVQHREAALKLGAKPGSRVVMLSSAVPHEGKSTVTTSLGLSLASAGHSVLVIDADPRRPQVLAALGLSGNIEKLPVTDALKGTAPPEAATLPFGDLPLRILPLHASDISLEMFRNGQFANLVDRVRGKYEFILIDTPPILALSDSRHIAHLVDEVILVTRWRKTSRFAAKAAAQAMAAAEAPVSGVVLNAVDLKTQSLYARDDALAFYSSYKTYYTD